MGLYSVGTAILPGLRCSSGSHGDTYNGQFSQRKKSQAHRHLLLLLTLLVDIVIHHFPTGKISNSLHVSSSVFLHSALTAWLLFFFHLSNTYLLASSSSVLLTLVHFCKCTCPTSENCHGLQGQPSASYHGYSGSEINRLGILCNPFSPLCSVTCFQQPWFPGALPFFSCWDGLPIRNHLF